MHILVAALIITIGLLGGDQTPTFAIDTFEAGTFISASSLGNAVTAGGFGSDATYKNPGALTSEYHPELQVMAAQEFDSAIFLARIGVIGTLDRIRYSLQLPFKTIQGISRTESDTAGEGVAIGTYSDQQFTILATAATDAYGASWGLTAKTFSQQIDRDLGTGYGFDVGVRAVINPQWVVGASIRNVLQTISWGSRGSEPVPLGLSVGAHYAIRSDIAVLLDVDYDFGRPMVNMGGTYHMAQNIQLRAGVNSVFEGPQMRLGFGMVLDPVWLDYGFSQVSALGVSHRLGVRYEL